MVAGSRCTKGIYFFARTVEDVARGSQAGVRPSARSPVPARYHPIHPAAGQGAVPLQGPPRSNMPREGKGAVTATLIKGAEVAASIRDELKALGVSVEDSAQDSTWRLG